MCKVISVLEKQDTNLHVEFKQGRPRSKEDRVRVARARVREDETTRKDKSE